MASRSTVTPETTASELDAIIGEIVADAYRSRVEAARIMGRVGVTFSPEQRTALHGLIEADRLAQAQSAVLELLEGE